MRHKHKPFPGIHHDRKRVRRFVRDLKRAFLYANA